MKLKISIIFFLLIPSVIFASEKYEPYITFLGFKLEKDNLTNIKEKLGEAPINHSGDAGDSYYALCYVLPKHNITIYFESGEMGGHNHDLLSFMVKKSKEDKLQCGALTNISLSDIEVGILKIGKDKNSIKTKLPQPISKKPFGIQHKNFGKNPFSEEDIKRMQVENMEYAFWDVFTSIEVYEQNGFISGYKVSRVTSY